MAQKMNDIYVIYTKGIVSLLIVSIHEDYKCNIFMFYWLP